MSAYDLEKGRRRGGPAARIDARASATDGSAGPLIDQSLRCKTAVMKNPQC
jgi:hypothetical protein